MKIYFCDECHESIPLKDIADNTITIEGGKIYHGKCRPKAAKPGGRVSYATAAVSLLLGLGVGAVVMAIWGDLILGKDGGDSVARQIARLETSLTDLKLESNRRLEVIERDLEESPGIDGKSGKLARAIQGVSDNGNSIRKIQHNYSGLTDSLRNGQEAQARAFEAFKQERKKLEEDTTAFVHQKLVPDLEKTRELIKNIQEDVEVLTGRMDQVEELAATSALSTDTTDKETGTPKPEVLALDPEKAKRRLQLLEQLKSKDGPKRFSAVVDLSEFHDREVQVAMVGLLEDPADYVRSTALTNLMDMGTVWAIPNIIPVLKNDDYVLRETAIAALEKLMGRSISLDPDANSAKVLAKIRELKKWWEKNKAKLLKGR